MITRKQQLENAENFQQLHRSDELFLLPKRGMAEVPRFSQNRIIRQ